jgi:hypothetical protein
MACDFFSLLIPLAWELLIGPAAHCKYGKEGYLKEKAYNWD